MPFVASSSLSRYMRNIWTRPTSFDAFWWAGSDKHSESQLSRSKSKDIGMLFVQVSLVIRCRVVSPRSPQYHFHCCAPFCRFAAKRSARGSHFVRQSKSNIYYSKTSVQKHKLRIFKHGGQKFVLRATFTFLVIKQKVEVPPIPCLTNWDPRAAAKRQRSRAPFCREAAKRSAAGSQPLQISDYQKGESNWYHQLCKLVARARKIRVIHIVTKRASCPLETV